ncbi:MAG: hypothetical protein Q7R41_12750, partial [Phycisphaerales bacterium]|nr:hypothetical protein [Phycisphaerales bacterium]
MYSDNLGSATQRIKAAYIDELYIYGGAGGSGTSTISATQTVFNGVSYNWPNGGLGNNFVLTTDTNGNLGWQNPTNLVPESGFRGAAGIVRLGVISDKVGIGTATPATKLDVLGDIQATGVLGNISASGFLSSGTGQIKFGGATYNFPTTLPSSGQMLAASSTAGSLVWRGLAATDIPALDASKITTGVFSSAQIPAVSSSSVPNLDASKITTGTFAVARIPLLDASQVASGTLPVARGGTGLSAIGAAGTVLTSAGSVATWQVIPAGLGGAGTVNKLALWSATGTLADSALSQAGGAVTASGDFNVAAGKNINVLSGNVTVGTGATTTVVSSGAVVVGGNLTVNSMTTLNGTVAINAGLMGDLKPFSSGGSALGSATSRFNNLFAQGIDVSGGQVTVNGIKYNWPSTAPAAGQMLAVNSAGAINGLAWQAPGPNDIQRPGTANLSVAASMPSGVTGSFNAALGGASLNGLTSGNSNTAIGSTALFKNTTGDGNTALGSNSLYANIAGSRNVGIGWNVGMQSTGSDNTLVGASADANAGITNATALGAGARATKSNQVVIGNGTVTETLLNGAVTNSLRVTGGTLAAGKILTSDANGNATWQPAPATGIGGSGT